MIDVLYLAALDDKHAAIKSTLEPEKVAIMTVGELYKFADNACFGGDIGRDFIPCLYSRTKEQWYYQYYLKSPKELLVWDCKDEYKSMSARLALPVCSVFSDGTSIIVVQKDNALVTLINCLQYGFTALNFDSVIWNGLLFLHAQSYKTYRDGIYFVYNYVAILKKDLSLHPVFATSVMKVKQFEKKYDLLNPVGPKEFNIVDQSTVKSYLQLFELNKKQDGVYLDNVRIYGG